MPRLSLYKPEKGQDYAWIDRQVSEMFQIGGTELYLHKYIGTGDGAEFKDVTQIQDLVFLENRDRRYDQDVYKVRGIYNVANIDFNLSQFGLFIDNDTIFLTVHINDWIKLVGRKPLSGDVLEFPHLRDEWALNDYSVGLPRYYVIEDVGRASEGFSMTWWPHLYRIKLKKITDSQQFADLLKGTATLGDGSDAGINPATGQPFTIGDILSTRTIELSINDAILTEAEADAPKSGYETRQFFTLAIDENTGKSLLRTADDTEILDASLTSDDTSVRTTRPQRSGYTGYLLGDGVAPNGAEFGHGISFPTNATTDDFFLRTDFLPARLFRYNGSMWIKIEDVQRMTMTNNDTRQTLKTSFINNSNTTGSVELAFDIYTVFNGVNASNIVTNINYQAGMIATVFFDDVSIIATVVNNGVGKARINFDQPALDGTSVQWKLFQSGVSERQALSKAIKPKADL